MTTNGLIDDETNFNAHKATSCDRTHFNKIYPKVKQWQNENMQHPNSSSQTEKSVNGFDKTGKYYDENIMNKC